MTPAPKKNTEKILLDTLTEALMGHEIHASYEAQGAYASPTQVRRIWLDFGTQDVGPVIGAAGSMKLAIQTIVAAPFGGDACQLVLRSTRAHRTDEKPPAILAEMRIRAVLDAMVDHYGARSSWLNYQLENSPSTLVVLLRAKPAFVDCIRPAIAKIIRGIGKRHGVIAVVSAEHELEPVHG